jgi:hypothetical protein
MSTRAAQIRIWRFRAGGPSQNCSPCASPEVLSARVHAGRFWEARYLLVKQRSPGMRPCHSKLRGRRMGSKIARNAPRGNAIFVFVLHGWACILILGGAASSDGAAYITTSIYRSPSPCTISKHVAGCVLGRPHRIFGVHPPTTHQNLKDVSGETRGLILKYPIGCSSTHRHTCVHY